MKTIYIWGIGTGVIDVINSINKNRAHIKGLIDSAPCNQNKIIEGYRIYKPEDLEEGFDYIIVAAQLAYDSIRNQLRSLGINSDKILCFFDAYDFGFNNTNDFINQTLRVLKIYEFEHRMDKAKLSNLEYEVANKRLNRKYQFPIIESDIACLERIINEKLSMCRFGDGEFEMIAGRVRPEFQQPNEELSLRLKEILTNNNERCITCIAKNYGDLDDYTERAQYAIRIYLTPEIRQEQMEWIDIEKTYYDTYVSRPYIMYKDKTHAEKVFSLWKKVWEQRDVVIVEGEYSHCGYLNTLFDNVNSIKRILCPQRNAWDKYEEILRYIKTNISKDKLLLISLGPTATVLAYDLCELGYQAVDMGQMDNEYEWYIRGVEKQIPLEHKYISEAGAMGRIFVERADEEFISQVIFKI